MISGLFAVVFAVWSVLVELAPWLLLGTAVAALLHRLVPASLVRRSLHGRFGVIKAVALGVPLPLCSCGVIPTALSLKKQGAGDKAAMAFLISTPQTGVDSVLVAAGFLGWPFALFKVIAAALLGIVGGSLVEETAQARDIVSDDAAPRTWRGAFDHGMELLQTIWRWLAFGVLISALLQVFVPAGGLSNFAGGSVIVAMLLALLVSVPLYVCATASVPIAAALVAGGLPLAAALVFLIAGPATNVATIGAVYRTFGLRSLIIYLATVIVGSAALGFSFDFVLTSGPSHAMAHHEHDSVIASGAAGLLVVLLTYFAYDDLRNWLTPRPTFDQAIELPIEGLTCNGCVRRLEKALSETEGVSDVAVQLEPGLARIKSRLSVERLEEAVKEAGYRVSPSEPPL